MDFAVYLSNSVPEFEGRFCLAGIFGLNRKWHKKRGRHFKSALGDLRKPAGPIPMNEIQLSQDVKKGFSYDELQKVFHLMDYNTPKLDSISADTHSILNSR